MRRVGSEVTLQAVSWISVVAIADVTAPGASALLFGLDLRDASLGHGLPQLAPFRSRLRELIGVARPQNHFAFQSASLDDPMRFGGRVERQDASDAGAKLSGGDSVDDLPEHLTV
jgi:hypothetical protein